MDCPSCGAKLSKSGGECPKCGAVAAARSAYFGGAARSVRASWGLPVDAPVQAGGRKRVSGYLVFSIVALLLIAAMLVTIYVMQLNTTATSGVALSERVFPDERLLACVRPYDADGNGRLSDSEAATITSLDLSGAGIADLTGIAELKALVDLDASNNSLSDAAPLAGLVRLRRLDLASNALPSFSATGLHDLESLDVSDNGMTALDLSSCEQLVSLKCSGNAIARLDLAACTGLMDLACDRDQNVVIPLSAGFFPDESLRGALMAYDTDGDGALGMRERQTVTSLAVHSATLQNLYGLAWFDALASLDASDTHLTSLDGADLCAGVTSIDASGCQIASVDLAGLARLTTLDLSNNPLASLDLASQTNLVSLDLHGCGLTGTVDLSACDHLEHADVTGNPDLVGVIVLDTETVAADEGCAVVRSPKK